MSVIQDLLQQIEAGIDQAKLNDSFQKKGEILELKDGVATVTGLDEVKSSEIVLFENGVKGLVLDLTTDGAGVLVLGDYSSLKQGDTVTSTGIQSASDARTAAQSYSSGGGGFSSGGGGGGSFGGGGGGGGFR